MIPGIIVSLKALFPPTIIAMVTASTLQHWTCCYHNYLLCVISYNITTNSSIEHYVQRMTTKTTCSMTSPLLLLLLLLLTKLLTTTALQRTMMPETDPIVAPKWIRCAQPKSGTVGANWTQCIFRWSMVICPVRLEKRYVRVRC